MRTAEKELLVQAIGAHIAKEIAAATRPLIMKIAVLETKVMALENKAQPASKPRLRIAARSNHV